MATRLPEPEPWCRVAAVLAEAAGVDESRSFDVAALAQAKRMRGIRYDWAGKPTCTWSAAAELLASLRAEQARMVAEIEQRLIAADQEFRASLPAGIPAGAVPDGISAGQLMMLSDPMPGSRRESVVQHALANPDGAIVYHPIREDAS
jgi:hypothetical protein